MSNWIDEVASKVIEEQEQLRHQEKVRLYKHSVIRAKLPNFMDALKERIREDIDKLRAKCPQKERYHCLMEARGEMGVRISRQGPFPRLTIQFECNADGEFAKMIEYTEANPYQGPMPNNRVDEFEILLSDDNKLKFKALLFGPNANRQFDNSATLAEYLLKRVIYD
jgi:hypothetical protein